MKLYDARKNKWVQKIKLKNYDRNVMYVREMSHFINCVNNKEKSVNDISQGVKTLEIVLAIKRASKIKKIVTLPK